MMVWTGAILRYQLRLGAQRLAPQTAIGRASVEGGNEIPGLSAHAGKAELGNRGVKKNRWRFLKRHRLKDGIPKEEEEKPRKQIVQQVMVQRNSFFQTAAQTPLFSHLFF
jgi:hypothetical protein